MTPSRPSARLCASMYQPRRKLPAIAAFAACLVVPAASLALPNYATVAWVPLSCNKPDVVHVTNPGEVNFAGNAADSPAFYAHDDTYLYFRFRMQNDPKHGSDLDPDVWAVLMQVPSGDRHQYQYRL